MSKPVKTTVPVWPIPANPAKPAAEPPGRVVHDARGNAVWNWNGTDSTTHLLRKLDVPDLALADDGARPGAAAGDGSDPYNQEKNDRNPAGRNAGRVAASKAPADSVLRQLTGKRGR